MKRLDRALAYSGAVFCGVLLWVGLASAPGDWHKPVFLVVGLAGLVALAVIILRSATWR